MTIESAETGCPFCATYAEHEVIATPDLDTDEPTSMPTHVFKCSRCDREFDSRMDIDRYDCRSVIDT